MVQRFNIVVSKPDGGVEMYPMKEWLRQHPDRVPAGLHPTNSTSHQLRNGLKRQGWAIRETPTEVRLIVPEAIGSEAEIDQVIGSVESTDQDLETSDVSFALEYQLRDFIARNLGALVVKERRLSLYVDATGRDGVEFPTAVGPIDILAIDQQGAFFVFELKRASTPDTAMGQLARYMGWVKQTIGRDQDVHGVIVAKSISNRLRYAASAIPNVSLFEYEVDFHLRPAHEFPVTDGS